MVRRRQYVAGAAAGLGGLLAGCIGSTAPGTTSEEPNDERSTGEESGDYSVSMEPMGAVEFDGPPERWTALLPSYADMGFALGAGQSLGIQLPYRYATHFYDELPGVSYDPDAVVTLNQNGVDKELFYEMGADLHFMEPNQLIHWYGWDEGDVREIAEGVAPFFGNFIRRRSDDWHDYRYYTLYEAFEKVARVFGEEERYREFERVHDDLLGDIEARLPSTSERPRALLVYPADEPPRSFYPYGIYDGGVGKKQFRDAKVEDAFADADAENYSGDGEGAIDLEALLEIDPDLLLVRGQEKRTESEFRESVVSYLREHDVASQVTAVKRGAVYRGGYLDQGPIINFFQTELAVQRIYPEVFGDEELFDRQRVADIVTSGGADD